MFCQLISADSPPRLISNIGYFESDRILVHLSFNSMWAAPHPCFSVRSDPAIFSTNRQVVRAKCQRDRDGAAVPCRAHGSPHSYLALLFFLSCFFFP